MPGQRPRQEQQQQQEQHQIKPEQQQQDQWESEKRARREKNLLDDFDAMPSQEKRMLVNNISGRWLELGIQNPQQTQQQIEPEQKQQDQWESEKRARRAKDDFDAMPLDHLQTKNLLDVFDAMPLEQRRKVAVEIISRSQRANLI